MEASPDIYDYDLVSFGPGLRDRGTVLDNNGASSPLRKFKILHLDNSAVIKKASDLTVIDRSYLNINQLVASAADVGGQIGVITGAATKLDLVRLDDRTGQVVEAVASGVPSSRLRRVRTLGLGDLVVSGPWLGQVSRVLVDVDVSFDDGAVCTVTDAEPWKLILISETYGCYLPQKNSLLRPGMRVRSNRRITAFKDAAWLRGQWNADRDRAIGTVVKVVMSGVHVHWIASTHCGTDQRLIDASAPPAYQDPHDLTFFWVAYNNFGWGPADRCFFADPGSTSAHDTQLEEEQHDACSNDDQDITNDNREAHNKDKEAADVSGSLGLTDKVELSMTVAKTRTYVDVLWQDGTRQHGIPSECIVPFNIINEQEFLPGHHVVHKAPLDGSTINDDNFSDGAKRPRRVGIVRSVCCKDQTVNVSWFKAVAFPTEAREAECNDTVSAYDLEIYPGEIPFHGDIVVRLLPSRSTGSETSVHQQSESKTEKSVAPADLSWVGHVMDLPDGHVQVKWGDGSISTVLSNEIVVVYEENYMVLRREMDEDIDTNTPEERTAASTDNDQQNPVEVGDAEGDNDQANEEDPTSTTNAIEPTADDQSSHFSRFDVLQSPPDHHFLDTTEGCSRAKNWAKTVRKEWKILENGLPETIYVRAFEDRMDLLRAVMVGASGTPYQDGLFFFDLQLPPSYPDEPPQVYYHSFGLRLNPNLYESGTVCLSLLNTFYGEGSEVWSPKMSSLLQVLVSIQGLILNDQPYYNEAGYETLIGTQAGRRNAMPYSENAYLLTLRTMLHLLRRPPQGYEGFVKDHFRRRGRFVLRTCEAYLQGCVDGVLMGDTNANEAGRERPCSAGLKLALANVIPSLLTAFMEIGAEGCTPEAASPIATFS